jgi:TetR/AcrR family transcriptional regulator, transcriptional repressor for nem operon
LTDAAVRVLHEQGVERTTLADIARAADIPVGNVYYYFKTKDDLVRAALTVHRDHQAEAMAELDQLADPRARLKGLVEGWIEQRDLAARHGCPTATLAVELGKRGADVLAAEAAEVFRGLLDWVARQFRELGWADPDDRALTLVSAYEGMQLLANVLHDPDLIAREGARLLRDLDERPAM